MPKCRNCKKEIANGKGYWVTKGQYFCDKNCYDEKKRKQLDDSSSKIKYKPTEGSERREFTDYVQSLYIDAGWDKSRINWTMVCSQAANILQGHEKWSYATLTYILHYMVDILDMQLITQESKWSPLSLVEYYGAEAEEYFNQTFEIEQKINDFEFNSEPIVIRHKSSVNNSKRKQIDLSKL